MSDSRLRVTDQPNSKQIPAYEVLAFINQAYCKCHRTIIIIIFQLPLVLSSQQISGQTIKLGKLL